MPSTQRCAPRVASSGATSTSMVDGAWVVTSYEDVRATLQEPRLSAQRTDGWIMQPADREGRPRGELLSRLVSAAEAGQIRGPAELLAQCAMLLFAGYETTRHSLGTSLYWLLSHPDAWRRLQSDATLLPGAVRELLRWDSPDVGCH